MSGTADSLAKVTNITNERAHRSMNSASRTAPLRDFCTPRPAIG